MFLPQKSTPVWKEREAATLMQTVFMLDRTKYGLILFPAAVHFLDFFFSDRNVFELCRLPVPAVKVTQGMD